MELDNPATWKGTFEAFMGEFADCYRRAESRESSSLYVRGLLADKIARKKGFFAQPLQKVQLGFS